MDLFRLCPPSKLCSPQSQSTCHYIVNHYVKILHVHLGVANNMHPLSWGGGGYKRKRSKLLYNIVNKTLCNFGSEMNRRTISDLYGSLFPNKYDDDNKCAWRIICKCLNCNNFKKVEKTLSNGKQKLSPKLISYIQIFRLGLNTLEAIPQKP